MAYFLLCCSYWFVVKNEEILHQIITAEVIIGVLTDKASFKYGDSAPQTP